MATCFSALATSQGYLSRGGEKHRGGYENREEEEEEVWVVSWFKTKFKHVTRLRKHYTHRNHKFDKQQVCTGNAKVVM